MSVKFFIHLPLGSTVVISFLLVFRGAASVLLIRIGTRSCGFFVSSELVSKVLGVCRVIFRQERLSLRKDGLRCFTSAAHCSSGQLGITASNIQGLVLNGLYRLLGLSRVELREIELVSWIALVSFPLVWKVVSVELVDRSIDLFSEAKLQLVSCHLRDVSAVDLNDLKHIL